MAHDLQDDLEFVAAGHDYDDFEFDDAGGNGFRTSGGASQYQLDTEMNDTSALEYRQGKDMQEIPWERLNYSRDQYRQMRLKQYKNYQSLARPRDTLEKGMPTRRDKRRLLRFSLEYKTCQANNSALSAEKPPVGYVQA
uniref:Uncharacterized protein n=1 Tax=Aegilops tauschii subsp. strangulata TaxID=200361 RepID=A0A453IF23_AEGTS